MKRILILTLLCLTVLSTVCGAYTPNSYWKDNQNYPIVFQKDGINYYLDYNSCILVQYWNEGLGSCDCQVNFNVVGVDPTEKYKPTTFSRTIRIIKSRDDSYMLYRWNTIDLDWFRFKYDDEPYLYNVGSLIAENLIKVE